MNDELAGDRRDRLVRDAIRAWRDGLVNLTGTNRLLNFRVRKTSAVSIAAPSAAEVVRRLTSGADFSFRPSAVEMSKEPEPQAPVRGRTVALHTTLAAPDLAAALRNLLRRSHQEFLDRGLRILYLAVGTLEWTDETGAAYSSPLLLVPVELQPTGPRQLPHLRSAEDDPVMNPALILRLAQSDVALRPLTDPDDVDPEAVLQQVRHDIVGRRGWRVADTLVLSYFTFAKEAMYRDLLDHEELIAQHPAVVALAAGGRGEDVGDFGFDEIQDQDVDRMAPADRTPLVLDADSSQRACIAAAVEGRSFVMDGPPGTGKSQTIANMIGALLHAGRTVLFVSEKAAALDVVRNRLAAVGMDAYLLELHSSKATRKEVAAELGRSLTTRPKAKQGMTDVDREQLRRRQDELNRYAAAMNEPRPPLNESLHAVIGRLVELTEVASAPQTGRAITDLAPTVLGDIRRLADALARAWRPALQGSSYVWRQVRHHHAMTARIEAAERALAALTQVMGANEPVAEAFGRTALSDAESMATLLEHHTARPRGVADRWLTAATSAEINDTTRRLSTQVRAVRESRRQLTDWTGAPSWTDIPASDGLAALDLRRIASLDPAPLDVDQMTGTVLGEVLDRLRSDARELDVAQAALGDVAALLRLPPPRTFDDADRLLFVAWTANDAIRPEARWLFPRERAAAHQALDHLGRTCDALDAAEAAARSYYADSALDAPVDVAALAERFRTQHTGLRRFGSAYRDDKATVAGFTREGVSPSDAHQHLNLIVEWRQAAAELKAGSPAYARDLGSYFRGRTTDRERASRGIGRADAIAARFPNSDLHGVAEQVAIGALPAPLLAHVTSSATTALTGWRSGLHQVVEHGPGPQFMAGLITTATTWVDDHITVLAMARSVVEQMDVATHRAWTVAGCRRVLTQRRSVESALAEIEADAHRHRDAVGALYDGADTDLDALEAAANWARDLHEMVGGPLTSSQFSALAGAVPVDAMRPALSEWRTRRSELLDGFQSARHAELTEELDDAADAQALLRALKDDADGQQEWCSYAEAVEGLRRHGLGEAVEFCVREQVPAGDLRKIVEKAVLAEWVDHHIATDPALQPVRAQDRNAVVAEFRELDRRVVATAVSSIVEVCNQRRPRSVVGGQAALIQREAEKKRKHMPVRELVLRSRDVAQAVKPCFMMSPLAVSQYLPPDLVFDVVIFDEASQVAPMDAINCVYRGRALITAGDAKQLPPTSFFALAGDDGDEWNDESDDSQDFESILDLAKSSGSFRSLTLKWHYRSRHESLIAFSNASFYKGQLVTFPGADHDGPDVGVELVPVQGVYRRGSSRDNPIEARKVAELVIHHYDTRPGRSVGVVTFSEAQASTIEAAVDELRRDRPDLDEQFAESRLDGFFVKSLESVQGDERDVMIFSIGYGPDENGKTTMAFGPLNRAGGWRRLNVAITRARYRNEIVSSIRAGDITGASTNEGLRHLRHYLDFAERGQPALGLDTSSGGDAESPFEESVIQTVRSWGYDVTPQVGAAGYRIDMAVHHPDKDGVYVLGVECDGAQYHSSRVARDRDRLRDQVLAGLGWSMHRIWGTDWYRDRHGAEQRLIEAVETAIQAPVRGLMGGGAPDRAALSVDAGVELEEIEYPAVPDWAQPYVVAGIGRRPTYCEPHEPAAEPEMRRAVQTIVAVEGPVHIEVVRQRLRAAWNIGQIGSRIRDRLDSAVRRSGAVRDGEFLQALDRGEVRVRTPTDGCRRAVEQVHTSELELAIANLVRDTGGITSDGATTHVARLYGWNRTGSEIRSRLGTTVEQLVADGVLVRNGAELVVSEAHPPEIYPNAED